MDIKTRMKDSTFTLHFANIWSSVSISTKGPLIFLQICVSLFLLATENLWPNAWLFMNPPMVSLRSPWGRDHYLLQLLIPSFHQKVLPYMEPKSGSLAFNLLLLVLPLRTICQPMLVSLVWNFRRWIHIQKQSSPRFQPSITPAVLLTTPHCWLLLYLLPTWNPVFLGFSNVLLLSNPFSICPASHVHSRDTFCKIQSHVLMRN